MAVPFIRFSQTGYVITWSGNRSQSPTVRPAVPNRTSWPQTTTRGSRAAASESAALIAPANVFTEIVHVVDVSAKPLAGDLHVARQPALPCRSETWVCTDQLLFSQIQRIGSPLRTAKFRPSQNTPCSVAASPMQETTMPGSPDSFNAKAAPTAAPISPPTTAVAWNRNAGSEMLMDPENPRLTPVSNPMISSQRACSD